MKKKIIALMGMAVISCALLMGCGSKAETPAAETTTEAESSDEKTAKTEETAEPEKADSEEPAAVTLEDGGKLHLDAAEWNRVLQTGLRDCGYLKDERVLSVKNVYKTDAI